MIRILVVDDHEIAREGIKAILRTDPEFDVVGESATADDLVDLVQGTRPDVVLLDASLPGVSGPEALRRLLAVRPDVPVLVVSMYSDGALVDECIRAGAKGYVVKDIERFALGQSIRAVHRGQGAASPAIAAQVFQRLRSPDASAPAQQLSDGQREILRLVSEGFSNREIAGRVHLSENTVKSHVQEIFRKLNARNRVDAALRASRQGLI